MAKNQKFCTFYLEGLLFGIPLEGVQEVFAPLEMTHVPLAPDVVSGLINLRGHLVTAVDLRLRLSFPPRSEGCKGMNVVIHTTDGPLSMLVDEIGEVAEVDEATFEVLPETLTGPVRNVVLGVHKLRHKLLHILDTTRVFEIVNEASG